VTGVERGIDEVVSGAFGIQRPQVVLFQFHTAAASFLLASGPVRCGQDRRFDSIARKMKLVAGLKIFTKILRHLLYCFS
ncbi:hypothetical protein, partial [uncultured Faecalibaculum sp.]|uniref:hypothetical protein n=1 Tax=uncultured Faecalibaculum sp. TaxID=1729681 RepID=UPI00272D87DF